MDEFLTGEPARTVQRTFRGASGRWGVAEALSAKADCRINLLVITDLTRPLREEELQAWQRLVASSGTS